MRNNSVDRGLELRCSMVYQMSGIHDSNLVNDGLLEQYFFFFTILFTTCATTCQQSYLVLLER